MLDEAGVKVLTKQSLQRVIKEGATITQLVASGGEFKAKVFIDTTYEGDLMAAAGVSWTIGREAKTDFGEALAGKQYPKPKIHISGFDADGKTLPLITTTEAGPEDEGDQRVMVYSFRLCLTKDATNRVPFPAPTHYDPARFEAVRRYFAQEKRPILLWDLYPLPGNKLNANNGIGSDSPWDSSVAAIRGAKAIKPNEQRSGKRTSNTRWSCIISSRRMQLCQRPCARNSASSGFAAMSSPTPTTGHPSFMFAKVGA